MSKINTEKNYCPTEKLFSFIGKKWNLFILKSISDGCKTFSEIEKNLVSVNPRILSARLVELQKYGFVEKHFISQSKSKAFYCLTKKGESFSKYLNLISDWTKKRM